MKVKVRKVVTKKALANVRRCDTQSAYLTQLHVARLTSESEMRKFVLQQWALHFGAKQPPDGVPFVLVEVKLGYHIAAEEMRLKGVVPSRQFSSNYKAAMDYNLQGFGPEMKTWLELEIKYKGQSPEKEQEMKAKRQKAAAKAQATKAKNEGKAKGPKKGATWVGLFEANYKAKMTDAELAKAMTKAMNDGHTYTEQEVVKNRGFFNFGAFGAKYPKPKVALEQFKDEKEEKPAAKKAVAKKK